MAYRLSVTSPGYGFRFTSFLRTDPRIGVPKVPEGRTRHPLKPLLALLALDAGRVDGLRSRPGPRLAAASQCRKCRKGTMPARARASGTFGTGGSPCVQQIE